ncbi:MAG: cytochrome d ubiquinol oxidase subunit II, partial [Rhodocyclaceae bacterium]|nr:cytochrome d ubiquinol oxidase subunit II [Rhodocyclaceae bacterium]
MDLNLFWFIMLGVLLAGYAVLDGFDLGVGILHLTVKKDEERRVFMNSIGPIWDGNEVWLVTFGGALFAAFPEVYATVFSGFYTAFMALLFALIFRAVSMEYRSKRQERGWRSFWDFSFFAGSTLATFLYGVAVGNAMMGMPIGADKEYQGTTLDLLHPYALLTGVFAVATFAMHGAIYLYLKTEGDLQQRIQRWMWRTFGLFLVLYLFTTVYTLVRVPLATRNFNEHPWVWLVVGLNILAIGNIPRAIFRNRPGQAFASSCATILAMTFFFGVALFPDLVHSSLNPDWSLNVYNSASSQKTLAIMRNIAFLGVPFVVAYTAAIFWVFRGKVK